MAIIATIIELANGITYIPSSLFGGAGGGCTPAGPTDGLLTEDSNQFITEAGDYLIWEA
jgi:hypothetical protein